jgi:hypothetical protein
MTHWAQILPNTGNRGTHSKERYFLEIRNRYKWLLEMGGERVLLYKRKYTGTRCPQFDQVRKTNQQHGQDTICFGTGWVGGYFSPIEIFASVLSPSPQTANIQEMGRRRVYIPTGWTIWEPLLQNGDLIIRQNGQRLWVTEVSQTRWKFFVLRQNFVTAEVERNHPVYQLPL